MLGGIGAGTKVLAHDRCHIQGFYSTFSGCPEGLKSSYHRAYEYLHLFLLKVLATLRFGLLQGEMVAAIQDLELSSLKARSAAANQ
jgi:hypothetical protein